MATYLRLGEVGWGHMDMDGAWGVATVISMIAFWLLVAALIYWLARGNRVRSTDASRTRETALEILDRRFAEGAIDQDEYRSRRRTLTGPPGDSG